MAQDGTDPTTGAPTFAGTGAPDTAVDLTLLGAFAAKVGTRPILTTAQRTAYAYAREGLEVYDTDLNAVYVHNGTGWVLTFQDWTSYTPTLTNLTGTVAASYQVIGATVHVRVRVTPITSMGTNPTVSLPVAVGNTDLEFLSGAVMLYDASAGAAFPGLVRRSSSTEVVFWSILASGTYTQMNQITASIPFGWVSADILTANFSYRIG